MKKYYFALLCFLLIAVECKAQGEVPLGVWAGEEVNEIATQFRLNTALQGVVMENVIVITALDNSITLTKIFVNRGNVNYVNRNQPLPARLSYGDEYKITEDTDIAIIEQSINNSKAKGLWKEEANNAAMIALLQQSRNKHKVIEVEVTLSNGNVWTFKM